MLDSALRRIVHTDNDDYRPYDRYGERVEGMSWIPLSGELHNDEFECFLLKMAPGASSKPHEHTGLEEFLVMDGELIDADGIHLKQGDYVRFLPGSRHHSHTPTGCTLLVMLRGKNRPLEAHELE